MYPTNSILKFLGIILLHYLYVYAYVCIHVYTYTCRGVHLEVSGQTEGNCVDPED